MWAKIGSVVITQILLPLIKDLVYMIVNLLKVRELRRKAEAERQAKVDAYKADPSDENFGKLP